MERDTRFHRALREFKERTNEEAVIAYNIGGLVDVNLEDDVLDIGGGAGRISRAIQPVEDRVTIIDVDEYPPEEGCFRTQKRWEEVKPWKQWDVVLASHVWGHFYSSGTTQEAFEKAHGAAKPGGNLVLVYNLNDERFLFGKIARYCQDRMPGCVIDRFEEVIFHGLPVEQRYFHTNLRGESFNDLAEMFRILCIERDEVFDEHKSEIAGYLERNQVEPQIYIPQKVVAVKKEGK